MDTVLAGIGDDAGFGRSVDAICTAFRDCGTDGGGEVGPVCTDGDDGCADGGGADCGTGDAREVEEGTAGGDNMDKGDME